MSTVKKINLKPGETLIEIRHQTLAAYLLRYFFGFAVLLAVSFSLFWLLSQAEIGLAIVIVGYVLGLYIIVRAFRRQRRNYWVITDQRLIDIDRKGFFDESLSSISLESIEDIVVNRKGIGAKIFNFGSLTVETGNEQYVLIIDKVKRPKKLADRLLDLCQARQRINKRSDTTIVVESFLQLIPDLPMDHLRQIQDLIDDEIERIEKEL